MPTADISVRVASESAQAFHLDVRVRERADETTHDVTLARVFLARLAPGELPESFVRRCFTFLLAREPKESILRRFDVSVIARYFPEFEKTIAVR
jgi:hypothetical protein